MTNEWQAGRLDSDLDGVGFDTLAVRAGQRRTPEGEHGEGLFTTSSYVFRSAADAAARFAGDAVHGRGDYRLDGLEHLAYSLKELRLVAVALFDLSVDALHILVSEHNSPLNGWVINKTVLL